MPAWVNTTEEEKAWKKAKKTVSAQRGKKEADFDDGDLGLVTNIAKNILRSSLQKQSGVIYALAKVEHLLDKRALVQAKQKSDDKLPDDAKSVVNALKKVMGIGGQTIAALRKAKTTKMEDDEAQALADELETIAGKLKKLLEGVKG